MSGASRDQQSARPTSAVSREFVEDPAVPDLYADEFWMASGPLGAVLTLIAVVPPQPGSTGVPKGRIVGRVRMSAPVAADLARIIGEQIGVAVAPTEQSGGPKN